MNQDLLRMLGVLETEQRPIESPQFCDYEGYLLMMSLVGPEPPNPMSEQQYNEMMNAGYWVTPRHQGAWLVDTDRFEVLIYSKCHNERMSLQAQATALAELNYQGVDLSAFPVTEEMHVDDFVIAVHGWYSTLSHNVLTPLVGSTVTFPSHL
jgi:hypothetical protein